MSLEQILQANEQKPVSYALTGPNVQHYKTPSQVIETALFKRFEKRFAQASVNNPSPPYLKALALPTLQLLRGLMAEIDQNKWKSVNENPDGRQLVQTCLTRLLMHLADAENHADDFGALTQALELVHAEIAVLLKVFEPFQQADFSPLYQEQLPAVPEKLKGCVTSGLARTSMNALAGIRIALQKKFENPCLVYQPDAHFEIALSMKEKGSSLQETLEDSSIEKVHFYLGDFNHNINLDPDHNHYQESDIRKEIEQLLIAKPKTDNLTVIIDCTIDDSNSIKVKELLSYFADDILSGRLTFAFIESGQKFRMLGFDDFYGSPFYRVGGKKEQWKDFDHMMTDEAYQTDPLSLQWFCLLHKYAPRAVDAYRQLIFDNTRRILNQIPSLFKPGSHPEIKVCTVAEGMEPCFIDIKINGEYGDRKAYELIDGLFKLSAENNGKIYMRGGYGYHHPTVATFPFLSQKKIPGRTVRINPGLSEYETNLIIRSLTELSESYKTPAT